MEENMFLFLQIVKIISLETLRGAEVWLQYN
jgi:hypothetical protein